MKGFILGVLIYSFILMIASFIKDNSRVSEVSTIDIIVGGPFCWILLGVFAFIRFINCKFDLHLGEKSKEKPLTDKQIRKILKKVIKHHLRVCENDNRFYCLSKHRDDDCKRYYGWENLVDHNEFNTRLMEKFSYGMYHQRSDMLKEFDKYVIPVTDKMMIDDGYSEYDIQIVKDHLHNEQLVKFKGKEE